MADVYERGERLRKERIQLGRTLHQQVRLLGMHPEDLNNLEFSKGSIEELDRLAKIVRDKGHV
jgi:transcriptional regulator with XRE-family HTH domain